MFILTIVTPAACFDSLFVCCGRRWADEHQQLFVASIGPGYDDSRIRPWVSQVGMETQGLGVALGAASCSQIPLLCCLGIV